MGKDFRQELCDAKEGQISEVTYQFARLGAYQTAVAKVNFVTRVADLGVRCRLLQIIRPTPDDFVGRHHNAGVKLTARMQRPKESPAMTMDCS
jgi:hypothetical protein